MTRGSSPSALVFRLTTAARISGPKGALHQSLHHRISGSPKAMIRKPIQFTFDFDGTLTKKDTLHLVAKAGYTRQASSSPSKKLQPWQDIVNAYMADYKVHTASYDRSQLERNTILNEAAWLDSLQDVERASAQRVTMAGIFDDVKIHDMDTAAINSLKNMDVALRPGWAELLISLCRFNTVALPEVSKQAFVQLVSVNWSRRFIWSVLWNAAAALEEPELAERVQEALLEIEVYANEVPSIVEETKSLPPATNTPAGQPTVLRTAGDKLKHMQSSDSGQSRRSQPFRVYIGDSTTDLECLLMADVGICMWDHPMSGGQKELHATGERLGILFKSLDNYQHVFNHASTLEELEKSHRQNPLTIYYAHDFHEVTRWLTRVMSGTP